MKKLQTWISSNYLVGSHGNNLFLRQRRVNGMDLKRIEHSIIKKTFEMSDTFCQATPASLLRSVLRFRLPSSSTRSVKRMASSAFHSASDKNETSASMVDFLWYPISVTTAVQAVKDYQRQDYTPTVLIYRAFH